MNRLSEAYPARSHRHDATSLLEASRSLRTTDEGFQEVSISVSTGIAIGVALPFLLAGVAALAHRLGSRDFESDSK